MPRGNKEVYKLGEKTRFDGETAVKASRISHEREKNRIIFREVIANALTDKDAETIARNLIEVSKNDYRCYEVLQAALGQKPSEKQEVELSGGLTLESYLSQFDEE